MEPGITKVKVIEFELVLEIDGKKYFYNINEAEQLIQKMNDAVKWIKENSQSN